MVVEGKKGSASYTAAPHTTSLLAVPTGITVTKPNLSNTVGGGGGGIYNASQVQYKVQTQYFQLSHQLAVVWVWAHMAYKTTGSSGSSGGYGSPGTGGTGNTYMKSHQGNTGGGTPGVPICLMVEGKVLAQLEFQ